MLTGDEHAALASLCDDELDLIATLNHQETTMETNGHGTQTTTRPPETVTHKVTLTVEAVDALAAIRALEAVGAYDGPTEVEVLSKALLDAISKLGRAR